MTSIPVVVPERPRREYEVRLDPGGLRRLGTLCSEVRAHRYAVIADSRVAELYGRTALESLAAADLQADLFTFPAGEWNKSADEWARLCGELRVEGYGRDCAVVGLGGGVSGDLAGFVASTYMRGVPVIQVPTTLLAMLDSAVGGKTAIDAGQVKNAVGTYHHPSVVLIDPEVLDTLRRFHRISGLAEAVKAAAIRDSSLFEWMDENAEDLQDGHADVTTDLIGRCVRIKADIVREDPEERGVRALLNFGHTFGHALESLSGFSLLHGEAVAAGLRIEARLGEQLGVTEEGVGGRLDEVLRRCGLPEVLEPDLDVDELLSRARPDKKARAGELRWVLLERIGKPAMGPAGAFTHSIPETACRPALGAALREAFEAADSPA